MAPSFAECLFDGFDIDQAEDETRSFLADLLHRPGTPATEIRRLYHASLLSGYEDWNLQLQSARALAARQSQSLDPLDGRDLLAFIPGSRPAAPRRQDRPLCSGWAETDRLIRALSESLPPTTSRIGNPTDIGGFTNPPGQSNTSAALSGATRRAPRRATRPRHVTSHFWTSSTTDSKVENGPNSAFSCRKVLAAAVSDNKSASAGLSSKKAKNDHARADLTERAAESASGLEVLDQVGPRLLTPRSGWTESTSAHSSSVSTSSDLVLPILPPDSKTRQERSIVARTSRSPVKSHFFATSSPPGSLPPRSKGRRQAGTVSSLPFPPLTALHFNLVQEKLCHEPFWLLIAVTFLIKTSGKLAIPAFYQVKERFPTPAHLADPEATEIITDMIRHLGLSVVRTAAIQRYARGWMEHPPKAGVRFRVRGYDTRDGSVQTVNPEEGEDSSDVDASDDDAAAQLISVDEADDAWEIGHLTQGRYALDSWRIFCRDELLGRAEDWNGKGAPEGFQPEWMRVRPQDKELRACLRWMWMKEGWEWDPATGEKEVLRPELARAVDEGRVEWDNTGGLRILEKQRDDGEDAAFTR
ncbi:hypothetical protein ACRALDRAFT_1080910 [Sodiomyces alcalophilus JCM 7366]|uniref:uncharacterized protein n=1 Tax=Sodiomyces alcalophilus JCM 7366 TaxID=591952 RepID=UPI0039B698A1